MTDIPRLLAAFKGRHDDGYVSELIDAASRYDADIVSLTCQRFIEGKVAEQSLDFPPSVPRWIREADSQTAIRAAMKEREQRLKEPPPERPKVKTAFLRKWEEMMKEREQAK